MINKTAKCLLVATLALGTFHLAVEGQSNRSSDHWVSTWATSLDLAPTVAAVPQVPANVTPPDFRKLMAGGPNLSVPSSLNNQTIRMIVHTTIGGSPFRIQLSNALGKSALTIGAAHVALTAKGASIDPATDHVVTFGGRQTVILLPGAIIMSDPVDMALKPLSDLSVSLFVPADTGAPTAHILGLHTAYIANGNVTGSRDFNDPTKTMAYLWLSSVDVVASPKSFSIVAFGDSITDGFKTTPDTNQAWPALLAKRLSERSSTKNIAVLNQGISGNQVLSDGAGISALARFDRDVLSRSGVKWIILLEGINDINIHGQISDPTALQPEDLMFGYRQIVDRAHSNGMKVLGATIMAEEGVWLATPTGEAKRQRVNEWIRTSKVFDAVVDFDRLTRDPNNPALLKAEFDSGDKIHPNDRGNHAMADNIDILLFDK